MSPLPGSCGVAFKEWASVCAALLDGPADSHPAQGRNQRGQAPGVFVPEHAEFWLYPTWVHQAEQGVRDGEASECGCCHAGDGWVPIQRPGPGRLRRLCRERERLPALEDASHPDGRNGAQAISLPQARPVGAWWLACGADRSRASDRSNA